MAKLMANGRFKLTISQTDRKWSDKTVLNSSYGWKCETTNIFVGVKNSKREIKRKLGHMVEICVCHLP